MKTFLPVVLSLFLVGSAKAQMISKFTWETPGNLLKADFGPDATSISATASATSDGANGTYGLNAGTGSHDINMVIPGTNFMVAGLDISIDFKRKESESTFFTLGNFEFGMTGGNLYSKMDLTKGSSDTVFTLGNMYAIPSDNTFHTYRFKYNSQTGLLTTSVDGSTVYSYQGAASRSMYWATATNVTVGKLTDGSNSNVAVLDNLLVSAVVVNTTLPLTILSFDAFSNGSFNTLEWSTIREMQVASITIERSADGNSFKGIGQTAPLGQFFTANNYQFTDSLPLATSYYRLKMTDLDGSSKYSDVKMIASASALSITCFPNPTIDYINIRVMNAKITQYHYSVVTLDGRTVQAGTFDVNGSGQLQLNVTMLPKGMLIVQLKNTQNNSVQLFKVVKK